MGPASFENLEHTLLYGTIRLNMAFVFQEGAQVFIDRIKRIRKNAGNKINIMLDAVGPRVKLGKIPKDGKN